MISLPPILKTSALAWPLLVGCGATMGPTIAAGALAAGALVLMSLATAMFAGDRFVASVGASGGGGIWGPLLLGKTMLVWMAFVQLVGRFPPEGLALGLCTLFFGAVGVLLLPREV